MNQLKDVKSRIRALTGDIGERPSWITDGYILPFINQSLDQCVQYLRNSCSSFLTKRIEVPSIDIGTSDLTPFILPQAQGQQNVSQMPILFGLSDPTRIEWKQVGQPDQYYVDAIRVTNVPTTNPLPPQYPWQMFWEWRAYVIFISPMAFPVTLRVRGEFVGRPLTNDDDYVAVHPNLTFVLAYLAAALAEAEHSPSLLTIAQQHQQLGMAGLDSIANELVRSEQNPTYRLGRITGRRRWSGYW